MLQKINSLMTLMQEHLVKTLHGVVVFTVLQQRHGLLKLLVQDTQVLVVAHRDPGVPNWLDPSGHTEGYITVRWIGAPEYPAPHCEQMSRSSLADYLPDKVKTIDREGRKRQLIARRNGVIRRFGY